MRARFLILLIFLTPDPRPLTPATLQELIDATPPGQTLSLPAGVYEGPAVIEKDLRIVGAGTAETILVGVRPEWDSQSVSVLTLVRGNSAQLAGLTIRDGWCQRTGGAISNQGTMTISNCVFTRNYAYDGGAIYNEADASMQISDCNFAYNEAGSFGGAIDNRGTATIRRAVFEGNVAIAGGALHTWPTGWGVMSLVEDCQFRSNVVRDACCPEGGAAAGALTMRRCVVSGNIARGGAGAGVFGSGSVLENCTITGNTVEPKALGGRGGGISGDMTLRNTTICGNWALEQPDVSGEITSLGGNVVGSCEPTLRLRMIDGAARLEAVGGTVLQAADTSTGPWVTLTVQDAPFSFIDSGRAEMRFYRVRP